MILRSQIELSANPLVLGGRSLEQGAVGLLEEPARVHPGFIEKELEEIVSQVIMGGDIFATSLLGVSIEPVPNPIEGFEEPRELSGIRDLFVGVDDQDPNEFG